MPARSRTVTLATAPYQGRPVRVCVATSVSSTAATRPSGRRQSTARQASLPPALTSRVWAAALISLPSFLASFPFLR
eukprot:m.657654 g.657654  ORF g.657654 m.657654 type:complete len:77 (+) comp58437_c0_seq2:851-1081(+)